MSLPDPPGSDTGKQSVQAREENGSTAALPADAPPEPETSARTRLRRRAEAFVRAHWLFLALAVVGVALRVVVSIAYEPALIRRDAVGYLRMASISPRPWRFHPIAYPNFLRFLPFDWELAVVPVVQHVLGIAVAALIYATLDRLGVRRWLAALAAAPVLLDGYQLNIEQYVLAETLFGLLLAGGCALLLWRRPLGIGFAGLAGLLFAAAALTRSIGVLAVLPALLASVFLADGMPLRWRLARPAVLATLFALPLLAYAAWFQSWHGSFALTDYAGRFLYGRVAPFADCSQFSVPDYERPLCPRNPVGQRMTPNQFMFSRSLSPAYRLELPRGKKLNDAVGDFAARVVRNQPLDYAEAVGSDFLRSFAPTRTTRRSEIPVRRWQFQPEYRVPPDDQNWAEASPFGYPREYELVRADPGLGRFVRAYQRVVYTPGPLLALAMLLGFAAALGIARARRSGLRTSALLYAGAGFVLLLGSVAATVFSWRYHLPQIVLFPPAAAIAVAAIFGLHERKSASS